MKWGLCTSVCHQPALTGGVGLGMKETSRDPVAHSQCHMRIPRYLGGLCGPYVVSELVTAHHHSPPPAAHQDPHPLSHESDKNCCSNWKLSVFSSNIASFPMRHRLYISQSLSIQCIYGRVSWILPHVSPRKQGPNFWVCCLCNAKEFYGAEITKLNHQITVGVSDLSWSFWCRPLSVRQLLFEKDFTVPWF